MLSTCSLGRFIQGTLKAMKQDGSFSYLENRATGHSSDFSFLATVQHRLRQRGGFLLVLSEYPSWTDNFEVRPQLRINFTTLMTPKPTRHHRRSLGKRRHDQNIQKWQD
jgi:hypothetical protein